MSGTDKLWLIVNTADYVCGLMLDSMLYDDYADEVTGAYTEGKIKSIGDFEKFVTMFSLEHAEDYQIDDVYDITMGVIDMVTKF